MTPFSIITVQETHEKIVKNPHFLRYHFSRKFNAEYLYYRCFTMPVANSSFIINQYKKRAILYQDFCLCLEASIVELLRKKRYKYQIFSRTKDVQSLREKIQRKKRIGKVYRTLSDIEDLAGIRIVFYLESDKRKFMQDLLHGIYQVIEIKELQRKNGYQAEHIVIRFNDKELTALGSKKFKYLKCEIQLVSLFNHAWAELEHDWIYKDVHKIKNKNVNIFHVLQKQMERIFQRDIKKTSLKFEKIAKQILSLKEYS